MKKLLILACSVCIAAAASAQTATDKAPVSAQAKASNAKIEFAEKTHDFGDIHQGDKIEYTFKFKNNGTEPLIVSNVQTTCGCTATNWTKAPVAPGKSGEVAATFNSAGKMGQQNKVITIYSNAGIETVSIVTNVLPAKSEATSANSPKK